jgi:O-antigen/teichoic acid export membrane protein
MWGMLLVISPFLVHYEQIVRLYVGERYLSAGTVMFLLLAGFPVFYGNILHTSLANAKVRMRSLAIRESISAVIFLSLTMVLVGHYQLGAIGVAATTFIVYGLGSTLIYWPFGKGMVGATWTEIGKDVLLPGSVPFVAALLVMKLLVLSYPVQSWSGIAINSMFGGAIYIGALWFVAKDIDKSQFRDALHKLARKVGG